MDPVFPSTSTLGRPIEFMSLLDNVVWSALTGPHLSLSLGDATARRYPAPIAPFGAAPNFEPDSLLALGRLLGPHEELALFTLSKITLPAGLEIVRQSSIVQMISNQLIGKSARTDFELLSASNSGEMLRLAELTKPGPFSERTWELGTYLGIRDQGQLIAMAGERMHLHGFTEVSAVCVHPNHRGQGFAKDLVLAICRRTVERDEIPILHAFADNYSAITLYEKLGFVVRTPMYVTVLRRTPPSTTRVIVSIN